MITPLIIAGVVVVSMGLLIKHLQDRKALHPAVFPLLLVAAAVPIFTARTVLNPGEPTDSAVVTKLHEKVELTVPEGSALMVTAELSDSDETDENERTVYALSLKGQGWTSLAAGTMKRENAHKGPDVPLDDREGVSDGGKTKSLRLGLDVQDRFDLRGAGALSVEVTNWAGTAASALQLEVIPAPVPKVALWGVVAVLAILGLIAEVKLQTDRLAGDLVFLAMWGVFIRDGVTPLDDWQEVVRALLPAALLGLGAGGGLSYLVHKFLPGGGGEEPEAPVAPPAAAAPVPTPKVVVPADTLAEGGSGSEGPAEEGPPPPGTTRRRRK